jgi:TatA/E family protein of Tat protein translocase
MHYLLFLEFIGTTELMVVLFFALILFGPRKLPELSRSLGRALNQMRAASDDLKHTWEAEAHREKEAGATPSLQPAAQPAAPVHAELQPFDEEPAGVEAQSDAPSFEREPLMIPAAAAANALESQPLELHA